VRKFSKRGGRGRTFGWMQKRPREISLQKRRGFLIRKRDACPVGDVKAKVMGPRLSGQGGILGLLGAKKPRSTKYRKAHDAEGG